MSDASRFGFVEVPAGYTSGVPLAATDTFANQTFATLGLTPGAYVYTLPNDTFTVQIGPAAVPEPASVLTLAVGAAGLAAARRRARRA